MYSCVQLKIVYLVVSSQVKFKINCFLTNSDFSILYKGINLRNDISKRLFQRLVVLFIFNDGNGMITWQQFEVNDTLALKFGSYYPYCVS